MINEPHSNDVLLGRGNSINSHPGNEEFRKRVNNYKIDYVSCPKTEKGKFAVIILKEIQRLDPPGRFLKRSGNKKTWIEVDEKKVIEKIRQALREGAPEILKVVIGEENLDSLPTTAHELRSTTPPPPYSIPNMSTLVTPPPPPPPPQIVIRNEPRLQSNPQETPSQVTYPSRPPLIRFQNNMKSAATPPPPFTENVDGADPVRLDQEGSSLDSSDAKIIVDMLQSVDTAPRSEDIRKVFSAFTKQPQLPVLERPKLAQYASRRESLDLESLMELRRPSLTNGASSMGLSSMSEMLESMNISDLSGMKKSLSVFVEKECGGDMSLDSNEVGKSFKSFMEPSEQSLTLEQAVNMAFYNSDGNMSTLD